MRWKPSSKDEGITRIQARRTRILLSNRLAVPGINSAVIGEDALQFTLDTDKRDRDGIYLGYNLPTLRIGEKGKLNLQPQFMLQRAIGAAPRATQHPANRSPGRG
jgi:hypothetical protein